jgi:hypothetical protein
MNETDRAFSHIFHSLSAVSVIVLLALINMVFVISFSAQRAGDQFAMRSTHSPQVFSPHRARRALSHALRHPGNRNAAVRSVVTAVGVVRKICGWLLTDH